MGKDENALLYVVAGLAVGALVVYIYLTQTNKTTVTDLTRDGSGRIISIVEKKV